MKNKNFYLLFSGLFLILILASCSETKTVDTQSEKYFTYLNEQNYEAIKELGSETVLDIIKKPEVIVDLSKNFYDEYGEVEEHEKYNQSDAEKKELNFWETMLYFKCKTKNSRENVFCKIDYIQEGEDGDPQISDILYSTDKAFIDGYEYNASLARTAVDKYYSCMENGDGEGALDQLHSSLSEEDNWNKFYTKLLKKTEEYGAVSSTNFRSVTGEISDNKIVFNVISMISTEKSHYFEKAILVLEVSDFKIIDFNFAKNLEDL